MSEVEKQELLDENVKPVRPRNGSLWRFPLIVFILALVIQLVGQQMVDDDVSLQSIVGVLTWFAAFLLISAWWLLFSKTSWRTRLAGVAGFFVILAGFVGLFRFEGQTGNFIPEFSFRFAPRAEDRALEYFAASESTTTANFESGESDSGAKSGFVVRDSDWPRFGGAAGDQIVRGEKIRTDWQTNPPQEVWRHPIGPGWSSFAVVGDYLFTQEQRGDNECVVCYDAKSGEQIWAHGDQLRFEEPASGAGPRATPLIFEARLYAIGATGLLNCLEPTTGELLWQVNSAQDYGGDIIEWAASGSPVIYKDLVIVNPATTKSFLAAYDRMTGEKRWGGPEAKAGYSTPVIATIAGQDQVIAYRAKGVGGYSLDDGKELWFFEWINATQINVAQPIVLPDESIFISTGYGGGSARLDVARSGDSWKVESRWERPNRFKLKFNSGIFRDGHVYGLDEGILSCFDVEEGRRTWKKGRYNFGQILMVNKQLLVLTEKGEVVLLDVSPEKVSEVARFSAIDGKTWNHPVLNQGRLFVRNGAEVACYDLSGSNPVSVQNKQADDQSKMNLP